MQEIINTAKSKNNLLISEIFLERKPEDLKLLGLNFSASCNFITQYNPMLPNIKTTFKKYLLVLHSNQEMLRIFLENTLNVTYKKNKNVKELISPSLFPKAIKENNCLIEKCDKSDIKFIKVILVPLRSGVE